MLELFGRPTFGSPLIFYNFQPRSYMYFQLLLQNEAVPLGQRLREFWRDSIALLRLMEEILNHLTCMKPCK